MAATTTAFIHFRSFMRRLGAGAVDLSAADTFKCELFKSATNLSSDAQISTMGSITNTVDGPTGQAWRALANVTWSNVSAPGATLSQFSWNSDALVWTASADMTVKFAVFYKSAAAGDSAIPIGYIQLVATEQTVTTGNTVTLTPNPQWFTLSG